MLCIVSEEKDGTNSYLYSSIFFFLFSSFNIFPLCLLLLAVWVSVWEREKELGVVFTLLGGVGYYSFQYVFCSALSLFGIPIPTMLNHDQVPQLSEALFCFLSFSLYFSWGNSYCPHGLQVLPPARPLVQGLSLPSSQCISTALKFPRGIGVLFVCLLVCLFPQSAFPSQCEAS